MIKLKLDLSDSIKSLEVVARQLVSTKFLGKYKSVFKGRGLEFEGYRQFTEEDDASRIDWKATMRSNSLLIKEFAEERDLDVFFLIDASKTMILSSTPKLKSEYAAELAASLTYATLKAGDNVGFALFTNKAIKKVPPARGMKQFYVLTETLVNPKMYGGKFDFGAALKFLMGYLKEGTLVIIISDFITEKENWQNYLKMAVNKFDISGIMVRDPIDKKLPAGIGQIAFAHPSSDSRILVEPGKIKQMYESEVKKEEKQIMETFLDSNADFLSLTTTQLFMGPLMNFFKQRGEKWR